MRASMISASGCEKWSKNRVSPPKRLLVTPKWTSSPRRVELRQPGDGIEQRLPEARADLLVPLGRAEAAVALPSRDHRVGSSVAGVDAHPLEGRGRIESTDDA
jgi:hypothetical protein